MWGRYWGERFWARRYWAKGAGIESTMPDVVIATTVLTIKRRMVESINPERTIHALPRRTVQKT